MMEYTYLANRISQGKPWVASTIRRCTKCKSKVYIDTRNIGLADNPNSIITCTECFEKCLDS